MQMQLLFLKLLSGGGQCSVRLVVFQLKARVSLYIASSPQTFSARKDVRRPCIFLPAKGQQSYKGQL